jgi:BirA family biotin operon repressor/biotin-[acetyl-CoA-carboxylase] ligase
VRTVAETGSTNADLVAAAAAGEPHGLVLVAERQTAGRGRLDRSWDAPPGTGLTFSVLLRPAVPAARLGWLPLLTGLAVSEAVAEATGVRARLKWPNDVVVEDRKLAGVLAEAHRSPESGPAPTAVVVGVGINVAMTADQLPVPTATSLALESARAVDREDVLAAVLDVLDARYRSWLDHDGDPETSGVRAAYTVRCASVGRTVRADTPGGTIEGQAIGIDADGRLRISDASSGEVRAVAAGDVVHLR